MPDINTVRGGVGVDPDDELDNLCQHGGLVLLTNKTRRR